MKAIVTQTFGTPPKTIIEERAIPVVKAGYSLVRMHSATINQLSNFIRTEGVGNTTAPLVLGNEGAGVIEQSDIHTPGTRVGIYGGNKLGITEDGLFQQYVLVENHRLFVIPDNLSFDQASTLSVNYLTAWQAMHRTVQVQAGQTVVISGASGAVGYALVNVAKALGARPIGLVSSADKAERAKQAGVPEVICLSTDADIPAAVARLTNGKGADFAFDPVGGALTGDLMRSLHAGGTVVSLGFTAGKALPVDAWDIITGEKHLVGYSLYSEEESAITTAMKSLMALAAEGKLLPNIDSTVGLTDYEEGYRRLTSRQAVGSIVLHL